jgi:hypothetical protein
VLDDVNGNPWSENLSRIFDMGKAQDVDLAKSSDISSSLQMYESKCFYQYDHRCGKYEGDDFIEVSSAEKNDKNYKISTQYMMSRQIVDERLSSNNWHLPWLIAYRNITNSTNERTIIASVLPYCATNYSVRLCIVGVSSDLQACLLGNLNSIVADYIARQKLGGTNLSDYVFRQIAFVSPDQYSENSKSFIIKRVLELTYVSNDVELWAKSLNYHGEPFDFNPERRLIIRAELDAYYAKLYGLSHDELQYILDPADLLGEDYPSETFRGLKSNEMKEFGEYRTRRLVLEAWDKLERGELV